MISNDVMINKELLFPNADANNFQEAVSIIGNKMFDIGFVKDSYVEAVMAREEIFPTGLSMGDYGISIPHTDRQHVKESILGIATFKQPISVYSMIEPEKEIKINIMFLMAVKDPDGQVNMLKKLMSVFQNKNLLQKLENASDKEEMYNVLSKTGL